MRLLGVVQWVSRDKNGTPIAGVQPLVEVQKTQWRQVDAPAEFPTQGQAFWWNPNSALEGSLVFFTAAPNAGQKDEFKVTDPKPVPEILDLRDVGNEFEVLAALRHGIRGSAHLSASRVLVWCKENVLIGPIEFLVPSSGTLKLNATNLSRVAMYFCDDTQVRSIAVDQTTRLLRRDDGPPKGYVDWDDDTTVLRRALDRAIRLVSLDRGSTGWTKKQIDDAAKTLSDGGTGVESSLDLYRLQRAVYLLRNTDVVTKKAGELAEELRAHPDIKASLNAWEQQTKADVEIVARNDVAQKLASEFEALREANNNRRRAEEAEAAMNARLNAAFDRPLELLAEVSVLRPFFGKVAANRAAVGTSASPFSEVDWSRTRGEEVSDKVTLRRALTAVARARGVEPAMLLQIHAAVVAGLMPVTFGPRALAALTGYAHAVCAGRVLIVHVSPGAVQPHDLDEVPGGGLLAAASAAKDVNGLSLVVLEGANRAPLEGAVVPLMQLNELGMSPLANSGGLRLAASLVAGATTVPVTPQLWSHAVAIYPDPITAVASSAAASEVALTSELLVPADEPVDVIQALLDAWPDCGELRPAMSRFGSALARFYEDPLRVSDAILQGLVLPYVASALSPDEQADAVDKAGDPDGVHAQALLRLRRRLT